MSSAAPDPEASTPNATPEGPASVDAPPAGSPGASELRERLGSSRVGLRPELEVSRHLFRGRVSYVVRDPITFESHRFSEADYAVLTALHEDHALVEIFESLVASDQLEASDEEGFYQFVVSLHRLGFLNLPIPDGKRLYQRFLMKEAGRRMKRRMAMFFYQLPLVNPDHFLDRTVRWVRPLFSGGALLLWTLLIASAVFVAARRWGELTGEVGDAFGAQNLPVLWVTIIVLKLFHELGHAYATKAFGGHVPEMGAFLIVFTPCAYVDASAAWGFSRKGQRIFVGLAGMYFELAIAAVALLAWAAIEPGMLRSMLFNIALLSSVVTVGFNINPLMRFDGYYVLSDLLEIPNLRQRSTDTIVAVAKRLAIGPHAATQSEDCVRTRITLCAFGVFAALYRITVVVSISMLVASKFFLLGLVLAASYIAMEALKLLRRVLGYLWFSEEARAARWRSAAISAVLIVVGGYGLFGVPLPGHVHASATVGTEEDLVLRAERGGFVREVRTTPGRSVIAGEVIAVLDDPSLLAEIVEARSSLALAEARVAALSTVDVPLAQQERETASYFRDRLVERERKLDALELRAAGTGWIARILDAKETGRYVEAGEEIATIAGGRFTVVSYLSAEEMAAAGPAVGDFVQFRPAASPTSRLPGTVLRVEPVSSHRVDEISLTQVAGGPIVVDPATGRAQQSYFRITSVLDPSTADRLLRHGLTGSLRFGAEPEPVALVLWRRVLVFLGRLDIG